jgi:hypothetical protein
MWKFAAKPILSDAMSGKLTASRSGWVLLDVPNAIVRGAFSALHVPGIELPPSPGGGLNAHISVMRPSEVEHIGGVDKINEIGKRFHYRLGPLRECNPIGWDEMERCWMFGVSSPELRQLRMSYGLNPLPKRNRTELDFHLTVAVRRKGVLRPNSTKKLSILADAYLAAVNRRD